LLGFEKRAQSLGIYDKLLNADIIPHGGGYVLPDILTVNKVIEVDGKDTLKWRCKTTGARRLYPKCGSYLTNTEDEKSCCGLWKLGR